ncbi:threonine synthase [Natronorubrum sediminis]|uniref:Threonine synthase n=1 Tax=Natronorubrum sediminis TaxID=640943 RepID=A0A1H6FUG8_9EURY|nr:threonine synthase [Natronorubrum sediminis]SEH13484.1 threonine synthase [Natronorubrum sediminis]
MSAARRCYACGSRETGLVARCSCGEALWLETDAASFEWDDVTDAPGMWRYESLLPVSPPDGLFEAAGGTPLVREPSLDAFAGARVHLKIEGGNPTGSFKDRGSALGLAALQAGDELDEAVDAVGTVSHGNMAISTSAYAAAAGLPCVVLVPEDIPESRLETISQFDPTVLRVAGDYGRLYERTLEIGPERNIAFLNSDVALRVEGQKTTALEICESFAPDAPDAIVVPTSSGGHFSGVWKALRELESAGVLADVPRLYAVQAAASAPIAEAYEQGANEVSRVERGETVAYSIGNPDPPSGTRALAAIDETDGAAVGLEDPEILEAQRTLAGEAGLSVEASSATALAGIRRLVDAGEIDASDDVVAVTTGTGLTDHLGSGSADLVDIEGLEERLAAFGDD